jgi:hypothetical protein
MVTHAMFKYQLEPFWDDEFKTLNYVNEEFNDSENSTKWLALGFPGKFTGDMCDMRQQQPSWNDKIVAHFANLGWKDIGTSYYRMGSGTILPTHGDLYKKYIKLYNLEGKEHTIRRAVIFLEEWKSGHYFEGMTNPVVKWQAGTTVEWTYDAPHMAANMGSEPRYTLQVTGHVDD